MKETVQDIAKKLKARYMREWREANKDRVREHNDNYWLRKAEAEMEKQNQQG